MLADKVYIIKKGDFIVTKTQRQCKKHNHNENIQNILEDPQRACKLNNKFFTKNIQEHKDKHTIAYVGAGNLIGVSDVVKDEEENPYYTSTVKCISKEAVLMYLVKEDFMRLQQQTIAWNFLKTLLKT